MRLQLTAQFALLSPGLLRFRNQGLGIDRPDDGIALRVAVKLGAVRRPLVTHLKPLVFLAGHGGILPPPASGSFVKEVLQS